MGNNNLPPHGSTSVASNGKHSDIEEIHKRILSMPIEHKAVLIKQLMGDLGLQVSFGGITLSSSVTVQVDSLDKRSIVEVLEAISNRF